MVKKLFCYSVLALFFTPAILLGQCRQSFAKKPELSSSTGTPRSRLSPGLPG